MRKLLFGVALLLLTVGCGKADAKKDKASNAEVTPFVATTEQKSPESDAKKSESSTDLKTLLFFLNPNGMPCQMQDQVLKQLGDKLTSKAKIEYVKTTEMQTARPLFMKYGIRALPSIIIINKDGSELKRFPPGIQSPDAIMSFLD